MIGKRATDYIKTRIVNIFPVTSVADSVVDDQLEDYIFWLKSAIRYILPAGGFPLPIALNSL
jgi:hypothetical protein